MVLIVLPSAILGRTKNLYLLSKDNEKDITKNLSIFQYVSKRQFYKIKASQTRDSPLAFFFRLKMLYLKIKRI